MGSAVSRVFGLLPYLWAMPTTLLGIAASATSLALPRRRDRILICRSSRGFARLFLTRRGYSAVTLGHLVVMTPEAPPEILAHELVHVRQAERWGPLFVPAYLIAMVVVRIRGGHPYWDNPFEAEARELSSGGVSSIAEGGEASDS